MSEQNGENSKRDRRVTERERRNAIRYTAALVTNALFSALLWYGKIADGWGFAGIVVSIALATGLEFRELKQITKSGVKFDPEEGE